MRAQISLEYLLLAFVALMLIGFSLFALVRIQAQSSEAYTHIQFNKDSQRLGQLAEELCLLGPGNSREIAIGSPIHIRYENDAVWFSQGNWSASHPLFCAFTEADLWGNLVLENNGGTIQVKV